MIHNHKDLPRFTARERVNHWLVAICFILIALSGLAFFHPAFWPLTQLFGGGVWARILHPFIGVLLTISFAVMFVRFRTLNLMTSTDWVWVKHMREMVVDGDDRNMPAQGKFNAGEKLMFWAMAACLLLMALSGLVMWRAYFSFPVMLVRLASLMHAAVGATIIGLIIGHIYAAIWTKGTIHAMVYGTVSRAWAKQHHETWYRQMMGR
ncbi:MAG: formate dehydrogenase subunit gamma [Syntrophales bacterium]|jgi:formate dehydrogenase subunit gamma|nr:formate dehydrogenase subunit gamma [Syntrophales bacterium]